ncbi:hypothetical protein K2X83_00785, partial [Patescibacteria group bacterium]|nr:hypothetical protein [Patescibacteria group bacterium]
MKGAYTDRMHTPYRAVRGIGALGLLIAFILFLVLLGILWATTGGPQRPISHAGPFLKPPIAPSVQLKSGVVQGSTFEADETQIDGVRQDGESLLNYFFNSTRGGTETAAGTSPYAKFIRLSKANSYASNPNEEYILIETTRELTQNITITGWTLESRTTAIKAPIGSAAQIPLLGGISSESPVSIGPGARIYVTTGRSPNGSSFRLNSCTGYFEQRQDFSPGLERRCPDPEEEALRNPQKTGTNVACIDFIDRLSACEVYAGTIPYDVGTQCRDFILNDLTYNGCVQAHRNDPGFYKNEWRLFLNRQQELWNNTHEQIRLLDEN